MTDESIREIAIAKRLNRMRRQLSVSALMAVIVDIAIRGGVSHGTSKGTNMLLFLILAAILYFSMKRKILAGHTSAFAWQGRSPWLLIYWPIAILLIIVLQLRFTHS